jgi:capsular exopolysaccharide synthesis family protein
MKPIFELQAGVADLDTTAPDGQLIEELVSFRSPSSFEADQYRALRHRVQVAHEDAGATVFAVTSAGPGEGKTITALNLAGALAQSLDTRVLVVDADVRRPSIAYYLRLPDTGLPGLGDIAWRQDCSLGKLTRRIDALNLSVLLAGDAQDGTYELLASDPVQKLIADARCAYDFVIIDTPPLLPLPDSQLLARWADGIVLVVSAHRTPREVAMDALERIDPAKLVAVAFNGDDRPLSQYYGYYAWGRQPGKTGKKGR